MESNAQDEGQVLLINKPLRLTSFDVVYKVRKKLKIKKIGHAGTLDPLATGLLIICVGKKTKQIESFMGFDKEYTGTFIIGQTTPSYDRETQVSEQKDISHITLEAIAWAAKSLTGKMRQLPPLHSAVKIAGRRAYKYARRGKEMAVPPRDVEVKEFEITFIDFPKVHFRILCSKGTYIRSIARDFGDLLGVGAYLSELCRTRIGNYSLENAITIDEVKSTEEHADLPQP
jgi:tRNA pseudouridine55 synthase